MKENVLTEGTYSCN